MRQPILSPLDMDAEARAPRPISPPPSCGRDTRRVAVLADPDLAFAAAISRALDPARWRLRTLPGLGSALLDEIAALGDAGLLTIVFELSPEGMPAFDSITALRGRFPTATLIVTTVYPSVALASQALRLGVDHFLAKPLSAAELLLIMEGRPPDCTTGQLDVPSLAWIEWEYINRVLEHTGRNISATARLLGVQRSTLQRKLKKYPPRR
jgi:two-component system response regulator RegA